MTWVTPPTFTAGAALSAVDLNKLADNQDEQGDAWTPYTSVWDADTTTPALGNGVMSAAYRQVGKTVDFWIDLTFGSTTTNGSGAYFWTLPVVAKTGYMGIGTAILTDFSGAPDNYGGILLSTLTGQYVRITNGSAVRTAHNQPVVWATSDSIRISGTYESV